MLNKALSQLLDQKKTLIMLHRGSHGGNIIENTLNAVEIAGKRGADIAEIDVVQSTDGIFYVFHDGREPELLKEEKNINQMSSEEIDACSYYNELNCKLHKKVERLGDLLSQLEPGHLINIDRSWTHWDKLLDFLDQFKEHRDYLLLKSPVQKEYLDLLDQHEVKYPYFPIIKNVEELKLVESYQNINLIGFEVIQREGNLDFFYSEEFTRYKNGDYFILANAINLDDDIKLFGPYTDELAITKDPDLAWGKLMDMGINCIQTDWVDLLYRYRKERYGL
ncbi:hypothetical protein D3H64_04580 [Atopobacter sp. AH10]|uniref:glycerophosphodiester phosphodiesterase family protein n=1 Tax=Atopobacter sp. AH10 TaxID=2315861 RepID=UPI000EF1E078|nr:glycerophosphodiester phosphodiesterase family protein [Atopobacter sp. AH10]RLK63511.1 hypothetical protein D3H64_04580 [Atopobacter sp. AH10]